jgi:DNA-binding response OmpR family regulator
MANKKSFIKMGNLLSKPLKSTKILLVEDDLTLAFFIKKKLEQANWDVRVVDSGLVGAQQAIKPEYDLIILDISLPELDGLSVLRKLRLRNLKTPVIIISGNDFTTSQLKSYAKGANIFHPKPLDFNLLIIQAKNLLELHKTDEKVKLGEIVIDYSNQEISFQQRKISLTKKELLILKCLLTEKNRTLNRIEILNQIYTGNDDNGENSIDVLVSRLRRKLEMTGGSLNIETVYGKGFRLKLN